QVNDILHQQVGPIAAAYTLPDFRELPQTSQTNFLQQWQALPEDEKKNQLAILNDEAKARILATSDPVKLAFDDQTSLWRASLDRMVQQQSGDAVADAFWRDRTSGYGNLELPDAFPDRELFDRGILGAVVRGQHHL